MDLRPPASGAFGRAMALTCFVFLVWRAGSAVALHREKVSSVFGTQLDALRRDEDERIAVTVAELERESKLPAGYLGELLAAVGELPAGTRVWVKAGPRDLRRRALVRLQHLLYPRSVRPMGAEPSDGAEVDATSCLLGFDSEPIDGARFGLRVLRRGPDWTLWGR